MEKSEPRCRFCCGFHTHWCPGGKTDPADRVRRLFGDELVYPGIVDAREFPVREEKSCES